MGNTHAQAANMNLRSIAKQYLHLPMYIVPLNQRAFLTFVFLKTPWQRVQG
jgi:hypothetical protein